MTNPTQSRKVRMSIPGADVSVISWLDCQHSITESVRQLIRESIQRDGYIDVANRPVEQLPRRGRPPQQAQSVGALGDEGWSDPSGPSDEREGEDAPSPHRMIAGAGRLGKEAVREPSEEELPAEAARPVPSPVAASTREAEREHAPREEDQPAAPVEKLASPTGQVDIDDIFGHKG